MKYIPLLLTASVDPRGMKSAMFSVEEREKMYMDTLNYYIKYFGRYKKDEYTLVFLENSGWDINNIRKHLISRNNVNVEMISLNPLIFKQEHGKGYNEMLMLDEGVKLSKSICESGAFFKVTGRFPIYNVRQLMKECYKRDDFTLIMDFYDQSFFRKLGFPFKKVGCECRYWGVRLSFYNKYLRGFYKNLQGDKYIEGELYRYLIPLKEKGFYKRFLHQAIIGGKASVHKENKSIFLNTNNISFISFMKYGVRQFSRFFFPKLWI